MSKLEQEKDESGQGFDTKAVKQPNQAIVALITLLVVGAIGVAIYIKDLPKEPDSSGSGSGSYGGQQRNCLASAFNRAPQCSDNNGKNEPTYINDYFLGNRTSVPQACWNNPRNATCQTYVKGHR